jgi:MYXO-CTERM domain-containing protein
MRCNRLLILTVVCFGNAPAAFAHTVEAHLSSGGVEWVQDQVKTLVPKSLPVDDVTKKVYSCPGDDATFTQRNTTVNLEVHEIDLVIPEDGTLRIDLTMSAQVDGEAHFENPYACLGSTTCEDHLTIDHARAVIDFAAWVDETGRLRANLDNIDLYLTGDQIDANFSDCAISGIVNTVIDLAKGFAVEMLVAKVDELAQEKIGPMLEQMLGNFSGMSMSVGPLDIKAELTKLDMRTSGIDVAADIDVTSSGSLLDICPRQEGSGQPASHQGDVPDLTDGVPAHLAVAVNLGLMDDALYNVWESGMMCVTPDLLDVFNIDLDLSKVGELLPGFPPTTQFRLMAYMLEPPTMSVTSGAGANMSLNIKGMVADLDAELPDGNTRSLHLELDASASVKIEVDPYVNALRASLVTVNVDRLDITEEASADLVGFDFGKMRQLLEDNVLPEIASEMTGIPLTGPIFGGMMGYYVILRELRSTGAYLVAKLDLFHAPDRDNNAPDTSIDDAPAGVIAAKHAFITVSGQDPEIPSELLQYELVVDGHLKPPTFVRLINVGTPGESGDVSVEVRAIDLHGNADPTPARTTLTIDGILPKVNLTDAPAGTADTASPNIGWAMSDDLTATGALKPVITTYRMDDDQAGQGTLRDEIELSPGQTSHHVPLDRGTWRVVVTVFDEAGNEASDSQIFDVNADAGGCGCVVRRGAGGPRWAFGLLALGLVMLRIRRTRRRL